MPRKNNLARNTFYKIILLSFAFILFCAPVVTFGQNTGLGNPPVGNAPTSGLDGTKIKNPISYNTINDFIKAILEGVIKIGIPIIALAIIYSGFLFVFAQGNEGELKKAKDALLYSIIGAVLLLGAWALAQLISETVLKL